MSKEIINIESVFTKLKEQINLETDIDTESYIPDIIEFCNSKQYLNLPSHKISLFPIQKIVLKTFYRGQKGNEHIKLTEDELQLLQKNKLNNVIEKYYSNSLFRELVLVLGRRAGKGFLVSLIALYETMKLLESPGGCPYKYYELAPGNPIYILTVATSSDQAKVLFTDIKIKLYACNYFRNKVGHTDADRIWLLTPQDKKHNKELAEQGLETAQTKGSIVIMSGHSNSDSLLGKGYYCLKENSMIITNQGIREIKDFSCKNKETSIDIKVPGLNGISKSDICFDNGKKKTLLIKTLSNNEIEVTPEHELYVWDGEFKFKRSENLEKGDYLVGQFGQNMWGDFCRFDFSWSPKRCKYGDKIKCPICGSETTQLSPQHLLSHGLTSKQFKERFPEYPMRSDLALEKFNNARDNPVPKEMTNSLARLLGYFIAEGNNTHKKISISNTDMEIANDMYDCAADNFSSVSLQYQYRKNKDICTITISGRKEFSFFEYLGCKPVLCDKKEIPNSILWAPKQYIVEFLKGYFEGDGHVAKGKNRVFCNSTSPRLIRQIYYILLNLGILSSIHEIKSKRPNHKNQYALHINGIEAKKFIEIVGFVSTRKKKIAQRLSDKTETNKRNLYGFPISALVYETNRKHKDILSDCKYDYGFYGFSNQMTQGFDLIKKWQNIYKKANIRSDLDKIVELSLFADPVVSIEDSESQVYDLHVDSSSHSYVANGLINHNCLLFDEVASFKTTGSVSSGERLYSALGPGTVAFNKPLWVDEDGTHTIFPKKKDKPLLDENGEQVKQLDSKIISISSPRAEEGIFFKLYNDAQNVDTRLAFRLPTWKVNLQITESLLRSENKYMSPNEFQMEFGAEFSGTAGEKFIGEHYIDEAIEIGANFGLDQRVQGSPGLVYFAHLDPASTSHNYAMVCLHVEERIQVRERENGVRVKEKVKMFVVDHIKVWHPTPGAAINVYKVDQYVIDMARRFKFAMVSYDSWNSIASIQKLRSKGIPTKMTPFRKAYKMSIYNQLEHLLVNHQLALPRKGPHAQQLEMELKCLKRKYSPTGFKIEADPEAQITTDDICVHSDTIVFTSRGPEQIKKVEVGDKILTHLGHYKKITGKSTHKPSADIFRLQPYYGLPLYATGNHPVEVFENGERKWKRMDSLTIKDKVIRSFDNKRSLLGFLDLSHFNNPPTSKHHNVCISKMIDNIEHIRNPNPNAKWHKREINIDYNFGYLCGIYAAEGNIADHGIDIAANICHTNIHEKIKESCKKTLGIETTINPTVTSGDGCQFHINSQLCKKIFLYLFGHKKAPEKTIPNCIMSAVVECQKGFIRGLFDGDGSINKKHTVLIFTSTSIKMTYQLQQLFLMFEIISSVSVSKRKGQTSEIWGKIINHNADLYNTTVTDAKSFNILSELMGLNIIKKQSKFHRTRYEFIGNAVIAEIRSISRSADLDEVVNISVEDDQSFVSGSVNTHNCDSLAGACGVATEVSYSGYPRGATVYMPQSRDQGGSWNIGRGTYTANEWMTYRQKFGKIG